MRPKFFEFLVLFFLVMTAGYVAAQVTTTNLYGRVIDDHGAAIPDATVTATNVGTQVSRTVQTNGEGEYRMDFMPLGNYVVKASAGNFSTAVRNGVVLQVDQPAHVDLTLGVGKVSETVEVTGAAPTVNTETAEIGATVGGQELVNLPIVGRNAYKLLDITPGVQSSTANQGSTNSITLGYPQQVTIVNGSSDGGAGSVSYYLDGGLNMTGIRNTGNILPNPDAIKEFRVETSNYNAVYGRMSGAVVNVVTNSGTNTFHGSLFDFYKDGIWNARPWVPPLTSPLSNAQLRNQFGATLGGPILRNKTFFFASYQGLRQITSPDITGAVVPSALERNGDFSQSIDPATGKPVQLKVPTGSKYPGQTAGKLFVCGVVQNCIPSSLFDPTAQKILNQYIPGANSSGNRWSGNGRSPYNTDDFLAKVDHALTSRQTLSLNYFETSGNNQIPAGGNLPWSVQQFHWRQHVANVSDTWTPTTSLVNQTWITFARNFGSRLNANLNGPGTGLSVFGTGAELTPQGPPSLPQITVTNYFTLGNAIAGPTAGTNYYAVRDVVGWTRGKHFIQFGAEQSLDKDIQQTLLNNYGVFTFNGTGETTNALANFLLGLPTSASQDAPVTAYVNFWTTGLFVQDDFKALPRLTLNLGMRWDIQTPPTDPLNREDTFIPGRQSTVIPSAPLGLLLVGDPGVTRGTVPVSWSHVSPRFGFAWDPIGDGKTAIRGAVGIFYSTVSGNEWDTPTNFEPFSIRYTLPNIGTPGGGTLTCPYTGLTGGTAVTCPGVSPAGVANAPGQNPFPYNYSLANPRFLPGGSVFGFSPDFHWPYTYQYNFSVQRQLPADVGVTFAYVGNTGHNLPFATDLNYPVLTPTATSMSANILSRRNIDTGTLGQIQQVQSNQTSWYNGLQMVAEKRMSHGVLVKASYVFSKTMSSAQLDNTTNMGGAQDFSNLAAERGLADFDIRHYFVGSLVWELNYLHGGNRALQQVVNGWTISPIVTIRSGYPFTVLNGKDANLDGNSTDRAQYIPGVSTVPAAGRDSGAWFNTAAFTQNPVTNGVAIDGNTRRNLLEGPGYQNVDLSFFRNFTFKERYTVQARLEASNLLNTINLKNPTGNGVTFGSSTFGKIQNANDMRQLQIGLRMTF